MKDLKREVECGLKAKYDQLSFHKKELEFFQTLEQHIKYEIVVINYRLNQFNPDFFQRLLTIKQKELLENSKNITSELILIDYFQNDIDMYFQLKTTKKVDNIKLV